MNELTDDIMRAAKRYRWLRDTATPSERDDVLGIPCGYTPDEPEFAEAQAKATDAAIDAYMQRLKSSSSPPASPADSA